MMTFEEFFKKKKINMELLKAAEPVLFNEFESHYIQMGEKSFDHTKKYLFNLLRRKYVLPPEPKVEKVIIENQLAEQTITEAITEQTPAPKLGFKPKFKTEVIAAAQVENVPALPAEAPETTDMVPPPKLGFKPKFKTMAPKPAEDSTVQAEEVPKPEPTTDTPVTENPEVKPVYKPKFQMRNMKPKAGEE